MDAIITKRDPSIPPLSQVHNVNAKLSPDGEGVWGHYSFRHSGIELFLTTNI